MIIDAINGRKRTAFDHALVAQGLSAALGAPQDPKRLPFDNLSFSADGKLMTAGMAARTFACELGSGMCSEVTPTNKHQEWLKSPDGRAGVSTRAGNLWLSNILSGDVRQITADGAADAGYGIWPDGWSANFVSRQPPAGAAPPLGAQWSPDSRTLLVPFVDQLAVAVYPFIESTPLDGSFGPGCTRFGFRWSASARRSTS